MLQLEYIANILKSQELKHIKQKRSIQDSESTSLIDGDYVKNASFFILAQINAFVKAFSVSQ